MGRYDVRMSHDAKIFSCSEKESLLSAARKEGIPIPLGCDNGGCGMCKIHTLQGETEIGLCSISALTLEERTLGFRLACRTYPKSDLVITLL